LGSIQQLKSKYHANYQIEIRCKEKDDHDHDQIDTAAGYISIQSSLSSQHSHSLHPSLQASMPMQLQDCVAIIATCCDAYEILEQHGYYLRVQTSAAVGSGSAGVDLVRLFGLIEHYASAIGIIDYSVAQANLEQIFLQIASSAQPEHLVDVSSQVTTTIQPAAIITTTTHTVDPLIEAGPEA
jgi:hypothetical protein